MLLELSDEEFLKLFLSLKWKWHNETIHLSSVQQISTNESYQRIIGLGPRVIPLILEDLRQSHNMWFWALRALTGENPVPTEHAGCVDEMRSDWIRWGEERYKV